MKKLVLIAFVLVTFSAYSQEKTETSKKIITLEKAALERWDNGDVYGFLKISASDVVYFDPMLNRHLYGLKQLTAYYKPLQGKIHVSNFEMIDPIVQSVDSMAVLNYNLKSYKGKLIRRWNCTEVYRKEKDGKWKIISTHWSLTKPESND